MDYSSIVFDMDGVILDFEGDGFDWKYGAVREALREKGVEASGMSRESLDAFLGDRGVEGCVDACEAEGIDPAETWELVAEKTTLARIRMMKKGEFQLYPEVKEVLGELESDKIQLGVISNAPERAVEAIISYYGLKEHFKFFRGVVDFEDLHVRKPHPDHLDMARAELKREPFLYAGDAESDLVAAEKAEMDSAWVKRSDATVSVSPDYEVKDLKELAEIVS